MSSAIADFDRRHVYMCKPSGDTSWLSLLRRAKLIPSKIINKLHAVSVFNHSDFKKTEKWVAMRSVVGSVTIVRRTERIGTLMKIPRRFITRRLMLVLGSFDKEAAWLEKGLSRRRIKWCGMETRWLEVLLLLLWRWTKVERILKWKIV